MELGEIVTVYVPEQEPDIECPFSHEKPNIKGKNELGGVGTVLAKNMSEGIGVHKEKPPTEPCLMKGPIFLDPRLRPDNPIRAVTITVDEKVVKLEDGTPLEYPLTCGAHHLVPAQESLREHAILNFMCKGFDNEKQDFLKNGKPDPAVVTTSKVWGNVLYNVNGSQNGVWLPGNYAVGGGSGAVEVWKGLSSKKRKKTTEEVLKNWASSLDLADDEWKTRSDPEEQDGPSDGAIKEAFITRAEPKYILAGKNYSISSSNPKWAYVKAAIDIIHGYFHDRHIDYSNEVKNYLTKISEKYEEMYTRETKTKPCEKCMNAERPDKADKSLVGPPYGIVIRLNRCGEWFKRHLIGSDMNPETKKRRSAKNIFTSKWIQAWMNEVGKERNT